ncbi:MAG: tetratricopeptide repeat protein [Spirochaetaceae bacterium]|nr:tetratricopeptide repeat protein [Spirochaetaceae bacterium]
MEEENHEQVQNQISELSQRGYQLLRESLSDRAISCFREILEIEDDNNYALVGLGDAYRKKRRFRDAVHYYEKCLQYHRGNNYALFGLADCYKAMKQYNRAIDIWEEYLHHDDKNITVLTRIADAYRKVRNFERSRDLYQKVLEMENCNSYAIIGLGHLFYDFIEYKEALTYWQKMLDLKQNKVDIRVLTSLGNCHRKMKTFDKGVPYFQEALDMQPNNFYALFGLADCYRGMNQQSKSLIYWNKILDQDNKNKVILTRAGDAYRHMGDINHAEDYYQKALNIEYDHYAVLGLALINKNKTNYREALSSLNQLIRNDPKNYRFYIESASCLESLGETEEAKEILMDFLKSGNRNSYVSEMLKRLRN